MTEMQRRREREVNYRQMKENVDSWRRGSRRKGGERQ